MATVFARLKVPASEGGLVDHGVHAFLVPIRDEQHRLMPGVDIKDCGYKVSRGAVYSCCVQLVCVQLLCVQLVCVQLLCAQLIACHARQRILRTQHVNPLRWDSTASTTAPFALPTSESPVTTCWTALAR